MIEKIRGLVRPVVTFAVVGTIVYGFVTKLIGAEVFLPLATMILVFWFESREKNNT